METKNENSDVSRAEEMKNQANEAFKGLLYFFLKKNINRIFQNQFWFQFSALFYWESNYY